MYCVICVTLSRRLHYTHAKMVMSGSTVMYDRHH